MIYLFFLNRKFVRKNIFSIPICCVPTQRILQKTNLHRIFVEQYFVPKNIFNFTLIVSNHFLFPIFSCFLSFVTYSTVNTRINNITSELFLSCISQNKTIWVWFIAYQWNIRILDRFIGIKRQTYKDINFDSRNGLWHKTELEKNCLRLRSIVGNRYNARRNVIK